MIEELRPSTGRGRPDLRGGDRDRRRHLRDGGAVLGALGRDAPGRAPLRRGRRGPGRGLGRRRRRSRIAASTRAWWRTASTSRAEARGRGVGRALLDALVASTEAAGIWTIQTGVFPENEASVRIHERVGFRVVGRRERIGQLDGVWRDVLFLERRSAAVCDRPQSSLSSLPFARQKK